MDGRLGQDEWRAAIVKHLQRERVGGGDTYDGNFDCSRLIGHRVVVSLEF